MNSKLMTDIEQQINHPVYIDTNETLQHFCQQWSQSEILALDTEFIRTDTFYPIGALIQVSDGRGCFLIDPLTIDDFSTFSALLTSTNIIKVLHSCSEDLEVFDRLFGVVPSPLMDTQIAAGLDGLDFSMSYQRMTEALLQIHIPKGETRSNWLQRPLTDSQIHYATLDVAYLPQMYQLLKSSLENKGRWSWLQEECRLLVKKYQEAGDLSVYYQKIRAIWKLSSLQLAILRAVTMWREAKARELDKPRGRVLKDSCCYEIARIKPTDIKSLSRISDINHKTIRLYGEFILDLVSKVETLDPDSYPAELPRPLPTETGALLKQLKAQVGACAESLQIPIELLAKKRDYEALLQSGIYNGEYQLPATLSGWRKSVIGDQLLELLKSQA